MTIQLNKEAKPNDKPRHKHADLIIAWANGAQIEFLHGIAWIEVAHPLWNVDTEYRIKPEPKPDVVVYSHIQKRSKWGAEINISCDKNWNEDGTPTYTSPANAKLTFDGETNELKSVEML